MPKQRRKKTRAEKIAENNAPVREGVRKMTPEEAMAVTFVGDKYVMPEGAGIGEVSSIGLKGLWVDHRNGGSSHYTFEQWAKLRPRLHQKRVGLTDHKADNRPHPMKPCPPDTVTTEELIMSDTPEVLHEESREGYTLRVYYDPAPSNPRVEGDNLGTIVIPDQRDVCSDEVEYDLNDEFYHFGPSYEIQPPDGDSDLPDWYCIHGRGTFNVTSDREREVMAFMNAVIQRGGIVRIISAYIHSGVTISAKKGGVPNCPWDSGGIGFIYATKPQWVAEYGDTPEGEAAAVAYLEGEVETYNAYINGDVYMFEITDENDDFVESCCGFISDLEGCIEQGRVMMNHEILGRERKAQEEVDRYEHLFARL